MALNKHGDANFPVTQKTTTVVQNGLTTKTVETIHITSSLPAVTIGSISGGLRIVNYQNEGFGSGLSKQTIVYEGATTDSLPDVPETTYESQGSMVELPIQQHPDFASWSADWDEEKAAFKPTSTKYGVESYIVGSVTVNKTEYFRTLPSDRYASVGTLEAPGGGYSASGKWLIISTGRSKLQEGLYVRTTSYLYSAKTYDTDIYS